jgi:hypothetical protein
VTENYANLYWTDITERKENDQALRGRDAQLALELTDATLQEMGVLLAKDADA